MAYGLNDRVREQVSAFAGGTGVVTLPVVAVSGFQTFLAGWGASGIGEYCLVIGAQWETGFGTLNAGGTTLTRTTVYNGSSGAGVAVNFSAGTMDCFGDIPAELAQHLNMREITVASATTCDIGAVAGSNVVVSGTTTITSFGTKANRRRYVRFSGALTLTHNGTSLILPGAANIVTIAGDTAIFQSDASGNWRCIDYKSSTYAPFAGKLIKLTVFTASGTWTRSAGCRTVVCEVLSGGGQGGGAAAAAAGQISCGGGGAGGGYSMRRITSPGATETATVGAGGTTGGAGVGQAGGTSSFGTWASATGGSGGAAGVGGATNNTAGGASPGVGASGDVNMGGSVGQTAMAQASGPTYTVGGNGGAGARGGGGGVAAASTATGGAGQLYGGGGGGALSFNGGAAQAGGAGGAGLVLVWEFE